MQAHACVHAACRGGGGGQEGTWEEMSHCNNFPSIQPHNRNVDHKRRQPDKKIRSPSVEGMAKPIA